MGRPNYADQKGEYYTAFFGLSVGLEQIAKLILVANHAITNDGRMPAEKVVRQYGHTSSNLMDVANKISTNHSLKFKNLRPTEASSLRIVECLDAFADAGRGRYANFVALGDPNLGQDEPIEKWWGEVAELILKEYDYGKAVQKRVEGRANAGMRSCRPCLSCYILVNSAIR